MVVSGETIEEVEALIKADVNYTNNVVSQRFNPLFRCSLLMSNHTKHYIVGPRETGHRALLC